MSATLKATLDRVAGTMRCGKIVSNSDDPLDLARTLCAAGQPDLPIRVFDCSGRHVWNISSPYAAVAAAEKRKEEFKARRAGTTP